MGSTIATESNEPSGTAGATAASRPGRSVQRLAGLLSGALALTALAIASAISGNRITFAPSAAAERIIRVIPGPVATFLIERLGHSAVRLLSAAVIVAFLMLAVLLPELSARLSRRAAPVAAALFFAALTAVAALAGPARHSAVAAAVGALATGVAYGGALHVMLRALPAALGRDPDLSRRRSFAAMGTLALAVIGAGLVGGGAARSLRRRLATVVLEPVDEPARAPARPDFPRVPGLSPEVTTTPAHFVVDINVTPPTVDPETWSLRVDGLVTDPLEVGLRELQRRFTVVEEYAVLSCVSNEVGGHLVGNSKWRGVRLADVLAAARPRRRARKLVFECADGYTVAVPLPRAIDPSALLAVAQNGRPLTAAHGSPCRVRIPALYGMMNAKWVERIRVVSVDYRGYWARRGWTPIGVVRTQSRIDTVSPRPAVGTPAWFAGVAWAGERGIERVEVSTDDGRTWTRARVREPLSPYAWSQWAYRWTPTNRGRHRVLCRAADRTGALQDAAERRPHPSGATGYHSVEVDVT